MEPLTREELEAAVVLLQKELADHDRWLAEVLVDFKIPFDYHKIGMRLALTRWMADKLNETGPQ